MYEDARLLVKNVFSILRDPETFFTFDEVTKNFALLLDFIEQFDHGRLHTSKLIDFIE